jgi:nucleoside-diphosphate-sugar epimerase
MKGCSLMMDVKNIDDSFVLTGATGFLGSHIMAKLLLEGKKVIVLGRASRNISLKNRIGKLLKWFGIEHLEHMIELYEADFMESNLGLGEYEQLCESGLSIIHCASDTSFAERNRKRVMMSNVDSLSNILSFAQKSNCRHFYYISSVYAAGIDSLECFEKSVQSSRFNNVYEESKAAAESLVVKQCKASELEYSIIRSSIVYGDSVTGRSLKFNALYYPVSFVRHIRDIYLNDINNNNGKKSDECGVYINNFGKLHLPIKIFLPSAGKINLIPVNYFTETFFAVLNQPVVKEYYNITSDSPKSMATLIEYTKILFNIEGIDVIVDENEKDGIRNPPEELFDHFIKAYIPYISDERVFRRENTDSLTGGVQAPEITYDVFDRCMTFATSVDWGKNLFYD